MLVPVVAELTLARAAAVMAAPVANHRRWAWSPMVAHLVQVVTSTGSFTRAGRAARPLEETQQTPPAALAERSPRIAVVLVQTAGPVALRHQMQSVVFTAAGREPPPAAVAGALTETTQAGIGCTPVAVAAVAIARAYSPLVSWLWGQACRLMSAPAALATLPEMPMVTVQMGESSGPGRETGETDEICINPR